MTYQETIKYLFTRLPMFQRAGPVAYKDSLENTLQLDEYFGKPHQSYKKIHVAGTNGKGSVSHMLASILQVAGYKTGLYTSPHLKDFRERIKVNGEMIAKHEVVRWVEAFRANNKMWKIEPSFFELTVALAFDYFAKQNVDIALVEVGLGGRLDSTNIISPEVSIITNIGLDHTNLLGNTLKQIAREKAGIIKAETPVVIGTTQEEISSVFKQRAQESGSVIYFADQEYQVRYALQGMDGKQVLNLEKQQKTLYRNLKLDLKGIYQQKNLPAVLKTIDLLKSSGWEISKNDLYEGLAHVVDNTGLLGRWQVIGNNPLTVCDTAHNEDGIKAILEQINNTAFKNLHVVFGTVGDKNPDNVLELLPKNARYYFTRANIPRALDEKELAGKARDFGLIGEAYPTVKQALDSARKHAGTNDFIFIGGSTFVVAEII